MNLALTNRFGRNGIYTDPRVLIPLVIIVLIRIVAGGYTPERTAQQANLTILQQEVSKQQLATHPTRRARVAPTPAAPPADPGSYRIQRINLDGTPVGFMPSPVLVAGAVGGGLAAMGAAGAFMMLRRKEDEPEFVTAAPTESSTVYVDEFYGDDELRDLVNKHDRS